MTKSSVLALVILSAVAFWYVTGTTEHTNGFLPHSVCLLGNQNLMWIHILADFIIGISYVTITLTLLRLVFTTGEDLPFSWMFVSFGVFIVSCGATHFMDIFTLFNPKYWLSGWVKVVCAAASLGTAIALIEYYQRILDTISKVKEKMFVGEVQNRRISDALVASEKLANLGRLSAVLAHETNNHFEALSNALYIVEANADTPTGKQMAALARQELSRVIDVMQRTLRFQREALSPKKIDIIEVLRDAISLHNVGIRKKRINLSFLHTDTPIMVFAFPGEMRQVFANLISNAVYASPVGGTVKIDVVAVDEGASIVINDSGEGLTDKVQARLFEPFVSTKGSDGSGIGLWVSQQIVTKHQGAIVATNGGSLGGAQFTVFLPINGGIVAPTNTGETK